MRWSLRLLPLLTLGIGLALPGPALAKKTAPAPAPVTAVQTKETQAAMTPEQSLALLKAGNARFVSGTMLERDLIAQVKGTASGQAPHAVVLGCIDSRVPPELVFDQGIGDIFAPRIAGNFLNTDILGSIEFATELAGAKSVVVLGHTACGAVKGACDGAKMGNLTHTLSNITPAVYAVGDDKGERSSKNAVFVEAVAEENVRQTVANLLERSPILAKRVADGKLTVIGAVHDISTGEVRWLDDTRK